MNDTVVTSQAPSSVGKRTQIVNLHYFNYFLTVLFSTLHVISETLLIANHVTGASKTIYNYNQVITQKTTTLPFILSSWDMDRLFSRAAEAQMGLKVAEQSRS